MSARGLAQLARSRGVKIDARANVWPLVPPNTANSQMLESNPNEKKAESAHALPA